VERCRRLVSDIIGRQASDTQLDDARRQYIGQLTLASTNSEQRALNMARSTLLRVSVIPSAVHLEHIRSLTPDDLREAASRLTALSRLTLV